MPRFVLLYKGKNPPEEDLRRIESLAHVEVLDSERRRLLLVEAEGEALHQAMAEMPGWIMTKEIDYKLT